LKRVLIISPKFAPVNAADMHRVRQSIQYYQENGWIPEVVMVDEMYVEDSKDYLLNETIPSNIVIHKIKAWPLYITRKLGLGNLGLRSLFHYKKFVNKLITEKKFDLIFFSTTAYPVCILGRYWKNKFKIPYIIDMQDPWRSDHYLKMQKSQRPPKFWISYFLDTLFERYAMRKVDGIMSVSSTYIEVLKNRYKHLNFTPSVVVPFAAFETDINTAKNSKVKNNIYDKDLNYNIVYVGRGGHDMRKSLSVIFKAFKEGLNKFEEFKKIRWYFIGTNYSTESNAEKTVLPIALSFGVEDYITEITNRIPYFESLKVLADSMMIVVPGSDNIGYTASKIYSYAWLRKPIITVFHSSSSVNKFMQDVNLGLAIQFDKLYENVMLDSINQYIYTSIINDTYLKEPNWTEFQKYTAQYQVKNQVVLFNKVISNE
jgi:hypothetical protein